MKLNHGLHLAYCTNIHRGENWQQTFESLQSYSLVVRDRVCPGQPYAIGMRLSEAAARELSDPGTLLSFQRWLEKNNCYVFTINGFPYGKFHGSRVKEQVYRPDWTTPERVDYTNRLFDLLAQLVPAGVEGSVSTVPGSFKEFITSDEQLQAMGVNLQRCVEHLDKLCRRTGRDLHLGLEPEPLCLFETTSETVEFINRVRCQFPGDERFERFIGVNYDTCHIGVEFEEPAPALQRFIDNKIRISKLHLSSALKVVPTPQVRQALAAFADDIYFHQVVERSTDGTLSRYKDLDVALAQSPAATSTATAAAALALPEWRIHFHIPLHSPRTPLFDNTTDHLLGVLDILGKNPALCTHLEMETYTWEVMPAEMKKRSVVDQLVGEYQWCLSELGRRGLGAV